MPAANLIAAASDVAVIIDGEGVIRDVAFNKEDLSLELDAHGRWLGSRLAEIVTSETAAKAKELLQDAVNKKFSMWRQVNHPSPGGVDIPVLYSAVNIGRDDRFVVVGRDLRPLAAIQQRLVNAQQSMERDYIRLRHAETRYRLLFQVSSEAVMIVDASNNAILEINTAALALLEESAPRVLKSNLSSHFDSADANRFKHCYPMFERPVATATSVPGLRRWTRSALSPYPSSGRRMRPCFWSACCRKRRRRKPGR